MVYFLYFSAGTTSFKHPHSVIANQVTMLTSFTFNLLILALPYFVRGFTENTRVTVATGSPILAETTGSFMVTLIGSYGAGGVFLHTVNVTQESTVLEENSEYDELTTFPFNMQAIQSVNLTFIPPKGIISFVVVPGISVTDRWSERFCSFKTSIHEVDVVYSREPKAYTVRECSPWCPFIRQLGTHGLLHLWFTVRIKDANGKLLSGDLMRVCYAWLTWWFF